MRLPEMLNQEISSYIDPHLEQQPLDYICVYGSSVYSADKTSSDVDMFVVTHTEQAFGVNSLIGFIKDMHTRHGRKIDEEVPFENKVHYSSSELAAALTFSGFDLSDEGNISVPPVRKEPAFLNSPAVKARLALNALTTPHAIIGKDLSHYSTTVRAAEVSATFLAANLANDSAFSVTDLYNALTESEDGQTGEMYLGYKTEYPAVESHIDEVLDRGLTNLVNDGVFKKQGKNYGFINKSKSLSYIYAQYDKLR